MNTKLPPHNLEAEQALLGCMLLNPAQTVPEAIAIFGGSKPFFDLRHQLIFDAVQRLFEAMKPINLVTIMEELRTIKGGDRIEPRYVSSLPDASPNEFELPFFANIVEEKAILRKLMATCTKVIQTIDEGEAPFEECLSQAEINVIGVRKNKRKKVRESKVLVQESMEAIEKLYGQEGQITGLTTGLNDLDQATDGLHPTELIVLAGYPGSGKTALAMNIAEKLGVDVRLPIGVFSLEMSGKRLMTRMITSRARINLRNLKNGKLSERDFRNIGDSSAKLSAAPMWFCEQSDLNIAQLRAEARSMVQQHNIGLFIVDYIQLVTSMGKKEQTREQEVSIVSRNLKQMTQEFSVPVIALSQLNDDGKLRESRAIGQDADSVWVLQTDKDQKASSVGLAVTLEIRKQRDGEAPKHVPLTFLKPYVRFENAPKPEPEHDDTPF